MRFRRLVETDKRLLLVMECIKGGQLRQKLQQLSKGVQKITEEEASMVIKAIAEGIAHLHLNDTIHRDLKPGTLIFACYSIL